MKKKWKFIIFFSMKRPISYSSFWKRILKGFIVISSSSLIDSSTFYPFIPAFLIETSDNLVIIFFSEYSTSPINALHDVNEYKALISLHLMLRWIYSYEVEILSEWSCLLLIDWTPRAKGKVTIFPFYI
jgi:hypothetical protein